jgi:hypothetical protein
MKAMCRHREKYAASGRAKRKNDGSPPPARHPVIANPQGEAIHAGTLDCFSAFAMTEHLTGFGIRLCGLQQSEPGKWRLIQPARRLVIANPQGEAIYARTLDCFTLRVRNDGCDAFPLLLRSCIMIRRGNILPYCL